MMKMNNKKIMKGNYVIITDKALKEAFGEIEYGRYSNKPILVTNIRYSTFITELIYFRFKFSDCVKVDPICKQIMKRLGREI